MADTELNISPHEKIAGVPLARLLRNLDETSYNEGAVDLACRLTDCKAVIEELLQQRALASRPAEVDDRTPRPMSTAPHDGTEVLAWSITGKTWHQVYWKTQENGDWLWEKPFPPRWACRWNSDYYQGQNEFSHWLPIPGAPSHTTNKEK